MSRFGASPLTTVFAKVTAASAETAHHKFEC